MERLEDRMVQAIRGTIDRTKRTIRPSFRDIDWDRTIRASLKNWQPELKTVTSETLHGHARKDLFPDLRATALKRHDIADWAARNDVVVRRAA
jgi:hypothetical protein